MNLQITKFHTREKYPIGINTNLSERKHIQRYSTPRLKANIIRMTGAVCFAYNYESYEITLFLSRKF
jgi:hypothetical protein